MAAEYKPEDKNQAKGAVKKDEPATPAGKPAGNKPEVNSKVQREMDAGKRALDRRKEEQDQAEKAKEK